MITTLLISLAASAVVAAIAKGLLPIIESSNSEPPTSPPASSTPEFVLPTSWDAAAFEGIPDMQRVYPRTQARTQENPITQRDSPISVISEPGNVPLGVSAVQIGSDFAPKPVPRKVPPDPFDPIALMAQTPFEVVGTIGADEFRLFSLLKEQKKKQSDIIKTLYHVARGGTAKYDQARERYLTLLKLYLETQG